MDEDVKKVEKVAVAVEQDVSKDAVIQKEGKAMRKRRRALERKIREVVDGVRNDVPEFKVDDREFVMQKAKERFGIEYVEELEAEREKLDEEYEVLQTDTNDRLMIMMDNPLYVGFVIKEIKEKDIYETMPQGVGFRMVGFNGGRVLGGKLPVRAFTSMAVAHEWRRPHGRVCGCENVIGVALFDQETERLVFLDEKDSTGIMLVEECQHPVDGIRAAYEGRGKELDREETEGYTNLLDLVVGEKTEAANPKIEDLPPALQTILQMFGATPDSVQMRQFKDGPMVISFGGSIINLKKLAGRKKKRPTEQGEQEPEAEQGKNETTDFSTDPDVL